MKIPVLRWPGGCFADTYHWKDGIGPKESRKKMINVHWGGMVEDNSFGTHEFFELCRQLECEPYINGNVGSGTVQEMQEWIEYMTFDGVSPMAKLREENGRKEPWKVKYFGVGQRKLGAAAASCGPSITRTCTAGSPPIASTMGTTSSIKSPAVPTGGIMSGRESLCGKRLLLWTG